MQRCNKAVFPKIKANQTHAFTRLPMKSHIHIHSHRANHGLAEWLVRLAKDRKILCSKPNLRTHSENELLT